MKLVPYSPSLKIEVPDATDLWKIPKEWLNKDIVTSVEKINDKFIYNYIVFSFAEMGWDGFFPYQYRGSTNHISDKLYVLVL
jgi:hypothetical protein